MSDALRGIVLAAGLGTRMRPLTDTLPKPLLPVAGKALIDYSLDFLAQAGIGEAVVNTSYKAELLEAHLRSRAAPPRVHISREPAPLETGGGIREALPLLGDAPFVSLNSDIICIAGTVHPIARLREAWREEAMDALLLLHPVARATGYNGPGDFFLNEGGTVMRRGDAAHAPYVFAGVQLLHPRLFAGCSPEGAFSLNLLYNMGKAADGTLPRIHALVHDGDWLHVGDPEGLRLAERYFSSR